MADGAISPAGASLVVAGTQEASTAVRVKAKRAGAVRTPTSLGPAGRFITVRAERMGLSK
jgi:hypothetical protein